MSCNTLQSTKQCGKSFATEMLVQSKRHSIRVWDDVSYLQKKLHDMSELCVHLHMYVCVISHSTVVLCI